MKGCSANLVHNIVSQGPYWDIHDITSFFPRNVGGSMICMFKKGVLYSPLLIQ